MKTFLEKLKYSFLVETTIETQYFHKKCTMEMLRQIEWGVQNEWTFVMKYFIFLLKT